MSPSTTPPKGKSGLLSRFGLGPLTVGVAADDYPLRASLLSAEQLEEHGRRLAGSHEHGQQGQPERLLERLTDNQRALDQTCSLLTAAAHAKRRITPASDWLLDNIYLVEEQIAIARRHLPRGYSRELPRLGGGPSAGLPRVYDIALNAISHGDGRVDIDSLGRYVAAYQEVQPLRLGELWAIPIMLRLALIENLRRVGQNIRGDRLQMDLADVWADRLTEVAETRPKDVVLVIADMARDQPPMTPAFVAELLRRVHGKGATLSLVLTWVEQWLIDAGTSTAEMVHADAQSQSTNQVSVSNSISSLRVLALVDWKQFVESASLVDAVLREDPTGTYARMDFETRDRYRHLTEEIARRGRVEQIDVARTALELARESTARGEDIRAHVGFYLADDGRAALERALAARPTVEASLRKAARRVPLLAYMVPIALIVVFFTQGLVNEAARFSASDELVWLVGLLGVLAFSELGVACVNWGATLLATPRTLPRMDYSTGIPVPSRTLVAVPTMFGSVATVTELVEALEVRFLANRDGELRFALLSDFFDAPEQVMPGDAELLAAARQQIRALNDRYADGNDIFFLFHRARVWNPREGVWMGYERKRGKLAAVNRVLRGGTRAAFLEIVGDLAALAGVRYVITLDSDTDLPRDAARKLVGTLAHPLNHAVFDPVRGVVIRGYGILQPRVGINMSGEAISWYARLFGSEPGIDPYTRAVSDVYQDLFSEGSFVGKGIYDVDAFEHALDGRILPNRVLSHDLLEGCYARAGVVSDVQLYEQYPARYAVDVKRRQRWIRGDWQLLPWLLPWVQRAGGRWERNPLSMLSRGKLVDNLRRSLVPTAMTALLLIGWLRAPLPLAWTLWVLSILVIPPLLASLVDFARRPPDLSVRAHVRHTAWTTLRSVVHIPLALACLPYEAAFSLGAIARTLWRLLVSRRHLLQWSPSSEAARTTPVGAWATVRSMWTAPVFAVAVALLLVTLRADALPVALPVLLGWFLSPWLMWWLGTPRAEPVTTLSRDQLRFLGRLARRTWAFFDAHVTAQDHWLPPDNVQEHPALVVARRTSPTNIGLSLLADLAAWDFGYVTTGTLATRIGATLQTLEALPRYRGHFFNWYDTETLQPLLPRYVSAVDSGNLAGHLLTLRQGLLELPDVPLFPAVALQGLVDTLDVLRESLGDVPAVTAITEMQDGLDAAMAAPPVTPGIAAELATRLQAHALQVRQFAGGSDASEYWSQALLDQCQAWVAELEWLLPTGHGEVSTWPHASMPSLRDLANEAAPAIAEKAQARIAELERLAHVAGQCAQADFVFLYDAPRRLLAIGYNVDEHRRDNGYYDLLASESRLGSYVAIAQGQLPQETWFAMGRLLTEVDGDPTLLSWSGSMFEYLMPQLVMPSYRGTLLDQTARNSVDRQIEYGRQRGVPWGISESGYQLFDARMNYQYRAFGVPGLGLKRGLAQDLVIAPYASMMALMVAPHAACENLRLLARKGFTGRFGLYEAIDYTPARLPPGQDHAVVRSFMVHHQGMGLLALDFLLRDQPMQRRFMADPEFQATLLLLQERIPRTGLLHPHAAEAASAGNRSEVREMRLRVFREPSLDMPAVQMLSNGHYHVMVGSAGGGYSRTDAMSVTRWREDATRDHWGSFCYVRDVEDGHFWSTAYQPTLVPVDGYEAIFSDAKAEFRGRRRDFEMHTEIAVSPEDNIELRRLRIGNRSAATRTVEITTYAEVVLAPGIADELHPAFSNLFVQTELDRGRQAILCTRRPRGHDETPPWMFHLVAVHDATVGAISYETDRARFTGRGNTLQRPAALTVPGDLSDSQGSVLDPIVAIRCRITLTPGQVATIDMVSGLGAARGDCSALLDKYRDRGLADRVFDMAWTHSQVVRNQINASQVDAQLYERLAGLVLYANPALRAAPSLLLQNRRGQSGLWGQSISGDLPIVLLKIADVDNIELVRQLAQAHAYWRLKGLVVDLVIWNEDQAGYRQQLQDQIMGLIAAGAGAHLIDRPGGIFVRPTQQMSQEDRILMQAAARIVLSDANGSLADQLAVRPASPPLAPLLTPAPEQIDLVPRPTDAGPRPQPPLAIDSWPFDAGSDRLILKNGTGGFSPDGREYVIDLDEGKATPAPWSNVMANAQFGCVLSESSPGYTWGENAHEFRLTPWHNDPVSDTAGEAFYLRDEETGRYWSPMPLPRRGTGSYRTRHGFGYSVFEHEEDGIASELWIYVDLHDAVKFSVLKLANRSGRPRRLSATGYVEWILGDLHAKTRMHVITEIDGDSGVLTARNPYNTEFEGRVAFFDTDAGPDARSVTGDRVEFLGRNGTLQAPAAMARERLSGQLGPGLDPCTAIQVPIALDPGQSSETVFRLGMAQDWGAAVALARQRRGNEAAHDALDKVRIYWLHTLGAIKVDTPDPAFNVLANGWLMYQTIACRFLARSGYYQSGGAFGFRDQLQDSMAMVHAEPALVRGHLLRSASHQFPEGDALHWWHPPQDRGVRTRCSDDYLWLPLAVCRYVDVTGDRAVLDEPVRYIEGRAVAPDEESYFDLPLRSTLRESLYQHCVRSIRRGLELTGARGLPLIATGDWNDGMNRVGEQGRGESVWLGFFLYDVLQRFAPLAEAHHDHAFATHCLAAASQLQQNLETHAWDGEWYQRAWFDNGAPLGSKDSDECRIDSISQSWAVLSGAGDPQRTAQAMASLDTHLVRRDAGLIQLLDPPFDKTAQDPGYIRGYVPGVRENGGQYTHSAVWATMAFARMGDSARAWELMRLISPVRHGGSAESVATYKVEPYVMAADVYAVAPHVGRGGWTWYTGSAGWMYRLMVESLLGVHREGARLLLDPRLPPEWPGFEVRYRFGETDYVIRVARADAGTQPHLLVDGQRRQGMAVALVDDGRPHEVQLWVDGTVTAEPAPSPL